MWSVDDLDPAQVQWSRVRPLTDWLVIVCDRLLSVLSIHSHTVGANTRSSEEFWGNLCTVSWLIELDASCQQCVHCGCCTMLGFMRLRAQGGILPPQQGHPDHWLFILFQSVICLRLHHWTWKIINWGRGHHRTWGRGVTYRAVRVVGVICFHTTSDIWAFMNMC